ncbi:hypothetical protein BDF22DRAFT_689977 [Syncephalis plumigaleata]|nr:hypothetical protein BDF22DRAFT_689977 [Syncephalis plumigaleata]
MTITSNHEVLSIIERRALKRQPLYREATDLLDRLARQVEPILVKYHWQVGLLREFLPTNTNLLGVNVNRGQEIRIYEDLLVHDECEQCLAKYGYATSSTSTGTGISNGSNTFTRTTQNARTLGKSKTDDRITLAAIRRRGLFDDTWCGSEVSSTTVSDNESLCTSRAIINQCSNEENKEMTSWSCLKCTFINRPMSLMCSICREIREHDHSLMIEASNKKIKSY